MKKPIQYFTPEYLEHCKAMTPEQILEFEENFRQLMAQKQEKCQLISLKIEPALLEAFKAKAAFCQIPYQTQIKQLMKEWLNRSK